jgi:hypothetical protein
MSSTTMSRGSQGDKSGSEACRIKEKAIVELRVIAGQRPPHESVSVAVPNLIFGFQMINKSAMFLNATSPDHFLPLGN